MDDQVKQRVMYALIAGNLAVIVFQIVFNSGLFGGAFQWSMLAVGVVIGLAVAAGTYFAVQALEPK
jgi:hypothetical protein